MPDSSAGQPSSISQSDLSPELREAFGRWTRRDVARLIDHTLLSPTATVKDVERHCDEALELGVGAVCVSPTFVRLARRRLPESIKVASVCGFPSGKHAASVKALEASTAISDGAKEIDMVIDVGALIEGRLDVTTGELVAVASVTDKHNAVLKVILETAALTDEQIRVGCRLCQDVGVMMVKTSTGFHPAGGASVEAVRLMARCFTDFYGVKASGGIRSAETAARMLLAGASRLGLSASRQILAGWPS